MLKKRYSRHELLKKLGKTGSNKLRRKTIAVVGLGGLGSYAASLLARAGINLILIDDEKVDETNLQRQILYTEEDIGKSKALAAEEHLHKVNGDVKIKSFVIRLNKDNIKLLKSHLVLDCTDDLETRFLINEYCVKKKIPWIYSGAVETKGVVYNIIPGGACFECVFANHKQGKKCADVGVLNTLVANVASIAVTQAVKILTGNLFEKDMIVIDVWKTEIQKIKVKKNNNCKVCKRKFLRLK